METALVTGATGMLGRAVVDRLLAAGVAVRALVRESSDVSVFHGRPVTLHTGAAGNLPAIQKAVKGVDWVFHTAGYVSRNAPFIQAGGDPLPEPYQRVNVQFTQDLLNAAEQAGVRRFVYASSASVYPLDASRPTPEDAPLRPGSHYGRSKLLAEQAIQQSPVPFTIIRSSLIYGPGDRHFLPAMLRLFRLPLLPLVNGGKTLHDLVYVNDVAELMVRSALNAVAANRIYNAGPGRPVSLKDFLAAYQKVTGRKPRIVSISTRQLQMLVKMTGPPVCALLAFVSPGLQAVWAPHGIDILTQDFYLDMTRAKNELGFRPGYSLIAGLNDTFAAELK